MIVFLSYASEHRHVVEEVAIALEGSGHEVFFDRESVRPGDDFRRKIRKSIDQSELFVFFISPESVAEGSYTRTEMAIARQKWKNPKGHLLPVMVGGVEIDDLPAYLKAVSILEPEGDVAAEVSARVDNWSPLEEIDRGGLAQEQIGGASPEMQAFLTYYHALGTFPEEVATEGRSNRTYRKTIPWSADREGRVFDDPTILTATRSQDFRDELGRTCCDVRMTRSLHGEVQWLDNTISFVLHRGKWTAAPARKEVTTRAEVSPTGDPELDELVRLLEQENA